MFIIRSAGCAADVVTILIDQFAEVLRIQSGLRARVGDRAAEPHVVAHGIHARRVLEQIIHVGLTNSKASVDVASIVRVVTISHVLS
jgi:hypothetical protein